jgi:hypothetical protein
VADKKIEQLILTLADKSKAGKLQWEKTATDGVFQVASSAYSVQLQRRQTERDAYEFGLRILDQDGMMIDEVWDAQLDYPYAGGPWYTRLEDLYTLARRRAMGVDSAIDRIISSLTEGDMPPYNS